MAKPANKELKAKRVTIETRVINAVLNNKPTTALMLEVELLLKEEFINDDDYNFLTNFDLIKEIHE